MWANEGNNFGCFISCGALENIYHRHLSLFDLCSLALGAGDCSGEVVADVFDVVRYEFVGVALK